MSIGKLREGKDTLSKRMTRLQEPQKRKIIFLKIDAQLDQLRINLINLMLKFIPRLRPIMIMYLQKRSQPRNRDARTSLI